MDIQENSLTFDKLALAVHERRCMRKKKPVIRQISESSADRQRMVINYADLLAIAVMPKKNPYFSEERSGLLHIPVAHLMRRTPSTRACKKHNT